MSFWESLDESKKDLCITGMHSGYIAGFARKFVIENFKSENNFNMLLQNQIFIEKHLIVVSQEEQAETERLERLGDLMEDNLRNEELEEEENDRLEQGYEKDDEQNVKISTLAKEQELQNEIKTEILTQNQKTEIMKTQEVATETETATENPSVNNTQNIVNNVSNVQNVLIVEKPKQKMSIADKIVEAQKMLVIAERKEKTEERLKEFHGYLHANKDGDNFTLMSLDKTYSFSTNNADLVKQVNTVLERFLKTKIQEFETELANFQI